MGERGKEVVPIESFLAVISTREVKPILASCPVSEDAGLPRGTGKAKGSRHSKEKCYLDDSFPSLHSLKSFWQKRGKNKRSLHLRVKPGGFGLQPGKGMNMNDCPN